jgi:hypothetical protein
VYVHLFFQASSTKTKKRVAPEENNGILGS